MKNSNNITNVQVCKSHLLKMPIFLWNIFVCFDQLQINFLFFFFFCTMEGGGKITFYKCLSLWKKGVALTSWLWVNFQTIRDILLKQFM